LERAVKALTITFNTFESNGDEFLVNFVATEFERRFHNRGLVDAIS
jgi:uncharacterized protein (DUF2164 family)